MSWNAGPGWTAQCDATDGTTRCALAVGHEGNHQTPAYLAERNRTVTRSQIVIAVAVLVGIGLSMSYLATGYWLPF